MNHAINNLTMKIQNLPRRSGKTASLKLHIVENLKDSGRVIVITPTRPIRDSYEKWIRYNLGGLVSVLCYPTDSDILSRIKLLSNYDNITILIDEPFLFPEEIQAKLIQDIELLSNRTAGEVLVIGKGTRPNPLRTFTDFLHEKDKHDYV